MRGCGLIARIIGAIVIALWIMSGVSRVSLAADPLAADPLVSSLPSSLPSSLSVKDTRAIKAVFKAAQSNKWKKAQRYARQIKAPIAQKIVLWMHYQREGTTAKFNELTRFIKENPRWPSQSTLHRRAEDAPRKGTTATDLLKWFDVHPPVTGDGKARFAQSLLDEGRRQSGLAMVRDTWITGNFTKRREKAFYRKFRKNLTRTDHEKRLNRLIWDQRYWPARRMIWKVGPGHRALAEARLSLMRRTGNVDKAISKVPDSMKNDPGLVYERVRWRRRKGKTQSARDLLLREPVEMIQPAKWWGERALLARKALQEGHITDAYRIVRDHGLTSGAGFADGEWLSGWISLQFLEEPKTALSHFTRMYKGVSYPVSKARAAYWAGRAEEVMNNSSAADKWYRRAAINGTTYYGQLARVKTQPGRSLFIQAVAQPSANEKMKFNNNELVGAVRILASLNNKIADKILRPFIIAVSRYHNTPGWMRLSAGLAHEISRPDLAITVAKHAIKSGWALPDAGYPAITLPHNNNHRARKIVQLERPLIMAVIRQESAFAPAVRSPAGARGLMQLMPRTALRVAKKLRVPFSRQRLIKDPGFNLMLGQAYLGDLIKQFDGSYVLSLAAYNAGPSRVRRWMRNNGDPRDPSTDAIDWIEMIPFSETRNYVQRILENLQLYRLRLAETEIALSLDTDLHRNVAGRNN